MQEFCEGRGRKTRVQDPRVVPLGFKPSAFATDASVDGKYSTPAELNDGGACCLGAFHQLNKMLGGIHVCPTFL